MRYSRNRLVAGLILILMSAWAWAGPVDLNTADAETIARELNGVGEARAQAIVAWREAHGAFRSAEELLEVDGIGGEVHVAADVEVDSLAEPHHVVAVHPDRLGGVVKLGLPDPQ